MAANALLAAIVESSNDAIVTKDLRGTITTWNKAAERIFGYSADEVIGGPISIIIPPERGAEEIDILQRISRGERIEHFETVRMRKDGKRIDVSVTISPLIENGVIVGASKIARDVTAQKDLARELQQQRMRLEVTLTSIGDGVIVTDMNGTVSFINAIAEGMTGWTQADAEGKPLEAIFNIVNERTRRRVENPVARALREGVIVGLANHTILISRTGIECAIDDSAAPIRNPDGEILGVVLVFRDVGGARAAEEHQARLAAIVESSDDAIIGKDLNGRITSWNAGATRVFGYSANEAVGRPISMLIPSERLNEEVDILARLRRGERIDHFETVRITKDRRTVHVSLTVSPIRNAEGEVVGASKIARDITERRRIQRELAAARAELQAHSEHLEKTVAERTAELRDALAQLETFSFSISHDLRAPLRAMNMIAAAVVEDYGAELRPEARELLERIVQAGTRLGKLVDEVLSSARSKLTPADLRPVPLATLVPTIVEEYPHLRQHRDGIEIKQPLLPVLGTEALLTQCISNLLGNAVKFVPASRPPRIEVRTEKNNGKVRICIRDNGPGIEAEHQERIFDLFSRGPNAGGVEGAGIGLAIVKRAVMRLDGDIGLSSEPDRGTEFWIELRAAEPGHVHGGNGKKT